MKIFELKSKYKPRGDQPKAIQELIKGIHKGTKNQVLLGATGTGKTFTIANVIAKTGKPALILSHNKTLAAQLYSEIKGYFPKNRVVYFISNFDYYRPEAYLPSSDTYIDKTVKSNWDIEAMRLEASNALVSSSPTIVVASVAAIYGQLNPFEYKKAFMEISVGDTLNRSNFFLELTLRNYTRNSVDIKPGTFRSRGDIIELSSVTSTEHYFRIETFDDQIEAIKKINYLSKTVEKTFTHLTIYPANPFTTRRSVLDKAIQTIKLELKERTEFFKKNQKLLELQRIEERVLNDINSLEEFGTVSGIENYSRHFSGKKAGEKPFTILDYLKFNGNLVGKEPLMIIDESHMMVPQLHAMYNGDFARKKNLVDYGFRLPSALDNRPLKFHEWEEYDFQKIFVSATPSDYELGKTSGEIVSQIVRPTGLLDPTIEIVETKNQVEDIHDKILRQNKKKERTFILTITKRMAEEFARHLQEKGIKAYYLHSEHKTFQRDEILRKFRLGVYDVVIGVNLIREGIDIPEVSLILVLDADKESFFRSTKSLIQIIGRAARNVRGHVVLYGDYITKSMKEAIWETQRRREIQETYNNKNKVIPKTIIKSIPEPLNPDKQSIIHQFIEKIGLSNKALTLKEKDQLKKEILKIRGQMFHAARELNFEKATELRDKIIELETLMT